MANLPLIFVVAAFLLTLAAAFWDPWRVTPATYRFFPHPGWLGLAAYFFSILLR